MNNIESDEENIDDMANMLESELLKVSPARPSPKSQSLLRRVQTRSPLVECKQKTKISAVDISKNSKKALLLKSKSFTTICPDSESLSDSESENTRANENKSATVLNIENSNTPDVLKSSDKRSDNIGSKDNLGKKDESALTTSKKSSSLENKIDHSEHSVFRKVQPDRTSSITTSDNCIVQKKTLESVVCHEVFPPEMEGQRHVDKDMGINKNSEKTLKQDQHPNIARKIDFVERESKTTKPSENVESSNDKFKVIDKHGTDTSEKLEVNVSRKDSKSERKTNDTIPVSTKDSEIQMVVKDNQAEPFVTVQSEETEKAEKLDSEQEKDKNIKGFDLDDLGYDDIVTEIDTCETGSIDSRETCSTPSLDLLASMSKSDLSKTKKHKDADSHSKTKTIPLRTENPQKEKSINISNERLEKLSNKESLDARSLDQERAQVKQSVNMSRQISSGFVLKSPPVKDYEKLNLAPHVHDAQDSKSHSKDLTESHLQQHEQSAKLHLHESRKTVKSRNVILQDSTKSHLQAPTKRGNSLSIQDSTRTNVQDSSKTDSNIVKDTSLPTIRRRDTEIIKESSITAPRRRADRRISQQGSLEFSVDQEERTASGNDENVNSGNKDVEAKSSDSNKTSSCMVIGNRRKSENEVLKEKYQSFIQSRRSSQESVESCDSQSTSVRQEIQKKGDNSEKLFILVKNNHSVEVIEEDSAVRNELVVIDERKNEKQRIAHQKNERKNEIKVLGTSHSNIPFGKKTTKSSEIKRRTITNIHQLVCHTFDAKTIPSSTVISPDTPKGQEHRPLSRTSISSPAPLSPLSISPFDFSVPMLISPLPPSPAPTREPVSPLPGSPWVEDDVTETKSGQKSTPTVSDKKITGPKKRTKRNNSKPCSFSSIVPTHAIHVKPISAFSTSATVVKPVDVTPKPVPAERDPMSLGKKQRISR